MANQAEGHLPGAQPARGEGPFVFYSWLHGRPVVDAAGQVVGRLDDLAVNMAETFPPVTALVVRRGRLEPFPLTARWRDVAAIDGVVRLGVPVGRLVPGRALQAEGEHWVRSTLLDRQIVDTSGAKVVRVNDLHFLRVASGDLHLVHVDVGFRGLMRRLGWDAAIDAAVRRLSPRARYLTSERLISWRYVQPLALSGSGDALRLSLPRGELAELHPAELADVLSDLDGRERESVFRALAPEAAAEALTEVEPKIREQLIASVPPERAAEPLLTKMERAESREVAELLRYEPDTAGGMMTTELVALPADLTCAEALERLRARAAEVEFIYYLYVVDPGQRLRGVITIRQLLVAAPETPLEAIMERDIVSVRPDDTRERVAEVVEKYNLLAVPVLDEEERLLGIVTVDDVLTHMTALAWNWELGRKR